MRVYENLEFTSENRMPARSYYIPSGVSEYKLLNGEWRFAYFERDIDVPEKIVHWDTIPVPSCWKILGYENPNYTNINYPYPCDQPYVPDNNPCGVYEREFELESKWGRLYFVFEGVSSCAFLSVNDVYVGYTQGSHLQAEFDITDYVHEGTNTVTVKVLKWCCGSYLEDQDAVLLVQADIMNEYTYEVPNPILWNAEKPFLYTVVLEREGEEIVLQAGLRKIEISDQYELLINDTSVKLFGVNHHDTHKYNGWCQTDEELYQDLKLMKELNINCVRTSHYPPTPKFVQICDELGFYVTCETDIETHGIIRRYPNVEYKFDVESTDWPGSNPEWEKEHIERMELYEMILFGYQD